MILRKLQTPPETCCIRLVFASVSLGMGADLKHIQRVVHAGPPTTLESINSMISKLTLFQCLQLHVYIHMEHELSLF